MRFVYVLSMMSALWLCGCINFYAKKSQAFEFERTWSEILGQLNHSGEGGFLDDDLEKSYAEEIKNYENLWASSMRDETKNVFVHRHVLEKNQQSFEQEKITTYEKNNFALAKDVIDRVEHYSLASSARVGNYDRGYEIGFCFARALLVHKYLLDAGIEGKDLRKIFALSDLLVGAQVWRFHMAVLVKSTDGFLVVDPLYGEPTNIDTWQKKVASFDIKKPSTRTRFYVTDARKFMPSSKAYSLDRLSLPQLKSYFDDLGRSLVKN